MLHTQRIIEYIDNGQIAMPCHRIMNNIEMESSMESCIFCQIAAGGSPSWKVAENDQVYAFLDINPVSKYHTLVIPKVHFKDIFEIDDKAMVEVSLMISKISKLYKSKLGIDNLQIICSNGHEAQQDVFHIHFHIVPRQLDDGQDIQWCTHPEWRDEFDQMLTKIS